VYVCMYHVSCVYNLARSSSLLLHFVMYIRIYHVSCVQSRMIKLTSTTLCYVCTIFLVCTILYVCTNFFVCTISHDQAHFYYTMWRCLWASVSASSGAYSLCTLNHAGTAQSRLVNNLQASQQSKLSVFKLTSHPPRVLQCE